MDMRLKILHIIASANPAKGGPIEGIVRQAEATQDICSRRLVTLDPPEADFLKGYPVQVTALGAPKRGGAYGLLDHYRHSPKLIPWLQRHVSAYDAVIVNGLWNYASFGASRVLPTSGVPYFVFTHGMMDPWFQQTYPLKHLAKQAFWQVCEGPLMSNASSALFTTEEEKLLARGGFWGHRYRETVVGYGTAAPPAVTAAQRTAFDAAAGQLKDRRYLLFLSRIHPKKGVDLLIEAFARTAALDPELQLVIAGPDQTGSVASLKAQASRLGIADRLHWPGMLQGDAKWGAYYGAEAFILPSHQENFGIVVAEAMGCAKPVLISDKINIWREVVAGGGGMVESDTVAGTTSLIERWTALPAKKRAEMGVAAATVFRDAFDVAITGPALIRTIGAML